MNRSMKKLPESGRILFEVCAADIDSVYAAANGGADRVELCCALSEGGLTPSAGMIKEALKVPGIKVNVLIRPRSGDFVYSEAETRTMLRDIAFCREAGVNGVVFGMLTPEGGIDTAACRLLACEAEGMHMTFHRAFDMCRDPRSAVRAIIDLGFDRILTSGQAATAMAGSALIGILQKDFPEITFMAAGGVTPANAAEIIRLAGVREIHASAKSVVASTMSYRHAGVSMGSPGIDEYSRATASEATVRNIRETIDAMMAQ